MGCTDFGSQRINRHAPCQNGYCWHQPPGPGISKPERVCTRSFAGHTFWVHRFASLRGELRECSLTAGHTARICISCYQHTQKFPWNHLRPGTSILPVALDFGYFGHQGNSHLRHLRCHLLSCLVAVRFLRCTTRFLGGRRRLFGLGTLCKRSLALKIQVQLPR